MLFRSAIIASSEDVAPDLKSCFEELVTNSLKKHKNLGPNDLLVQLERKLPDEIAQDVDHLHSLIEISAAAKSKDKRNPFLTNLCDALRMLKVNFVKHLFLKR